MRQAVEPMVFYLQRSLLVLRLKLPAQWVQVAILPGFALVPKLPLLLRNQVFFFNCPSADGIAFSGILAKLKADMR